MACCLYWFLENRPVSAFIIHVDKRNNTERSPLISFRETQPYSIQHNKCSFFGTRLVESTFDTVKVNLDFGITFAFSEWKIQISAVTSYTHVEDVIMFLSVLRSLCKHERLEWGFEWHATGCLCSCGNPTGCIAEDPLRLRNL